MSILFTGQVQFDKTNERGLSKISPQGRPENLGSTFGEPKPNGKRKYYNIH